MIPQQAAMPQAATNGMNSQMDIQALLEALRRMNGQPNYADMTPTDSGLQGPTPRM